MERAVEHRIRQAQWQLRRRRFIDVAAWVFGGGTLLAALWTMGRFAFTGSSGPLVLNWVGPGVLALAAAFFAAILGWRNLSRVARELDREAGSKDRFLSALVLKDDPNAALIQKEVARYSERTQIPKSLGGKTPRLPFLLFAVAAALLVTTTYVERQRNARLEPAITEARAILEKAANAVREQDDPKLRETTRELEEKLREISHSSDPRRDAFRALADLERQLAENTPARERPLTSAESAALADAMAANDPAAAAALAAGPSDQTADQISRLDPEALAKALEEAARHVESSRLREMQSQSSKEMRYVLSQAYRKSGRGDGSSKTTSLLRAIRDIKSGEQQNGDKESEMGETAPGNDPAKTADKKNAPPGGSAGQEHDKGEGGEFAEGKTPDQEAATRDRLTGQSGDGPATGKIVRTDGADGSRAGRGMTPPTAAQKQAALDAITQEDIPAGSQILVRRYFEAIRPAE